MHLTLDFINKVYFELKNKAYEYYKKNNIGKSLLYTHLSAYTNASFFLSYKDEDLEALSVELSKCINRVIDNNYTPNKKRCVMLDSLSRYRGGLTVQYVRAIINADYELLYITEQELDAPHHIELNNFLKSQKNIKVIEVPVLLKGLKKLQYIYDSIITFSPSKLFEHLSSYDATFTTISYSLPKSIVKYSINIADHGFLLGYNSCDFSFEFRALGCNISSKYRHQSIDKMFLLPFYPIIDDLPFKDLPNSCSKKNIILSGGRFWKIIDSDDTFFKLVKRLTDENPDTIILFPGSGNDVVVKQKIVEYKLENKFILLGWRDDLSALFRHSDIFLNTFPHGGGTMSQYAAHLRIPILSYMPETGMANPVECFVCQSNYTKVSSMGFDDFLKEAKRLLYDIEYRKDKADAVYNCVLGINRFDEFFEKTLSSNMNQIEYNLEMSSQHDLIVTTNKKIDYYNKTGEYQMRIVALAGLNKLTMHKEFIYPFVKRIIPKLKRVFLSRGFHFNRN